MWLQRAQHCASHTTSWQTLRSSQSSRPSHLQVQLLRASSCNGQRLSVKTQINALRYIADLTSKLGMHVINFLLYQSLDMELRGPVSHL